MRGYLFEVFESGKIRAYVLTQANDPDMAVKLAGYGKREYGVFCGPVRSDCRRLRPGIKLIIEPRCTRCGGCGFVSMYGRDDDTDLIECPRCSW